MKNSMIIILLLSSSIIFPQQNIDGGEEEPEYYTLKNSRTSIGFDFLSPVEKIYLNDLYFSDSPANQNQTGIYLSTNSGSMIFECYFGYAFWGEEIESQEIESLDEEHLWLIGKLGLLANMTPLDNKISSYAGLRIGKAFYEYDGNDAADEETDLTIISPLIGAEYHISDNFSFSGEVEFENIIYEDNDIDSNYSAIVRQIKPQFILRFYF